MDNAKTAVSDFFSPLLEFIDNAKSKWDDFKEALSNFSLPKAVGKVAEIGGNVWNAVTGGGSHYHGLEFVPYDGYQATLHKNEQVLSAEEAKASPAAVQST
ncbi:hypothetical protein SAMN05216352_11122 [Alteribacillus bidgolensis]|uniref:Uncharacterized protein n=2 Tax=Alteribacillus bidgolensis TaxID=930129 RepID=A0A1G8MXN3_9BACI|nr:hypothetical protein SAMN05216352_11122 [Alteribacillus bidgolensis]